MVNNIQSVKSKKDFDKLYKSNIFFVTKYFIVKYTKSCSGLDDNFISLGMCIKKKAL